MNEIEERRLNRAYNWAPGFIVTTNDTAVALVGKVGSSSISKALLDEQYPELKPPMYGMNRDSYPGWQRWNKVTRTPVVSEIIVPVRDPVERFRSACSQLRITDVDTFLTELESGNLIWTRDFHLAKVPWYCELGVKLYRFPDHIAEIALRMGVSGLPVVNDGSELNPPKPELTPEQTARVLAYYAEDAQLFELASVPGTPYQSSAYVKPVRPVDEDNRGLALARLRENREAAIAGGFVFEGKQFQTRNTLDILNIMNVGMAGSRNPNFVTNFRATDNTWVPMNAAKAQEFYEAMLAAGQAVWESFGQKEALILAAQSAAELETIDLSI